MSLFRSLHGQVVLVLGPHLGAISGVSAHLKLLLRSALAREYVLDHFQVGREGRLESRGRRWLRLVTSPLALLRTIRRRRPDIVHLNTSLNARAFWRDIIYAIVAKLHGARVVCQVHGGKLPQEFLGDNRLARALLRFLLGIPDVVVVLASVELAAYRRFLPGKWIALLPNGIDPAAFAHERRDPSDARALRLVFLGRLAHNKGVHELLAGLQVALERGARVRLYIAGSGPEESALRSTVSRQGLENAVTFAGATFEGGKSGLLRETDVFVLPSQSEGLPIALLEAMAAGNAVIATPVGAMPDVVMPGRHGLLVPAGDPAALADAIRTLDADREAVARMQQACAARIAAGYSLERLAEGFIDLYAQLTTGRARGHSTVGPVSSCAE
jgi:glycosyltransferase involved in cell wall biosynthesis